MPTLIFDTDFLSSFLQIGRCELIREFYQVDQTKDFYEFRKDIRDELLK